AHFQNRRRKAPLILFSGDWKLRRGTWLIADCFHGSCRLFQRWLRQSDRLRLSLSHHSDEKNGRFRSPSHTDLESIVTVVLLTVHQSGQAILRKGHKTH